MELILTLFAIFALIYGIIRIAKGKEKSDETVRAFSNNIKTSTEQSSAFINSTIKKAQKSIEKSVSKSYITGCSWIKTNDETAHILYTFRNNNELLITTNGIVQRAQYELMVDNNSVLITKGNITEHYNLINVYNDFLFLNKVSSDLVIVLANQTKFKDAIKANLNAQARQFQNFEIEQKREKEKYTVSEDTDHMFISVYSNWQTENQNKSLLDFITELEGKSRFDPTEYNRWQKYNEGKNSMDYAKYLVHNKYNC